MNTMTDEEWSISSEVEDCEPTHDELDNMYALLDKGGTLELKWKCPGKRAPSPVRKEEVKAVETPEQKAKQAKEMEFDFMDDVGLPTMQRHRQQTPKSIKKKTNFDGVLNQMRKHGRISTGSNTAGAGGANSNSGTQSAPTTTNSS